MKYYIISARFSVQAESRQQAEEIIEALIQQRPNPGPKQLLRYSLSRLSKDESRAKQSET